MALVIGPGLQEWLVDHQATPLGDETYLPPDYGVSALPVQLANAAGEPVVTLVGWDKANGVVIPPGPGVSAVVAARVMYDAVNWQAIPADAQEVAGYMDGAASAWPPEAWARWPHARRITVLGNQSADICDCETGDLNERQAATWYHITGGVVYIERSRLPVLLALGVPIGRVWVADWTGEGHLFPGSWGTQYANPTSGSGGDYDLSELAPAS